MYLSIRIFIKTEVNDANGNSTGYITSYEKPLQQQIVLLERLIGSCAYRTYLLLIGIVIRTRSNWLLGVGYLSGCLAAAGGVRSNARRNAISAAAVITARTSPCNQIGSRVIRGLSLAIAAIFSPLRSPSIPSREPSISANTKHQGKLSIARR